MSTRRIALAFVLLVLALRPATAQVVTTDPAVPSVDGPVTVYFDATQGTGGLAGYTGDVYAHTGVITNLSNPKDGCTGVGWRHVQPTGGWGQNTDATRLERVGPDRYKLEIADVRDYYDVPVSEEILRLAFVFRSADTSREGKATGGCDIFVDLAQGAVSVRLLAPQVGTLTPFIAERDTTVRVVAAAAAEGAVAMRALVGNDEVGPVANDTLAWDLTLDAPGRYDVTIIATDDQGRADSLTFYAVRNPERDEAPRPAVEDGVTFSEDGTSATFVLFAPYHDYVYLLGDFNDWEVHPDFYLHRETAGADSAWFWITVDGLTPGAPYRFQYLVDGEVRVADPFSHLVLQPGDDDQIRAEGRFPGLLPYPDGQTQFAVGVADSDLGAYDWQHDDFEAPPSAELVIYELLLRDFLAESTYDTLVDTLDYLVRLGVNAIELMPVSEFDGNLSWGYNPAFHLAPDKYYGPPEALKRFVDAAHGRGLAVILDVVYNHATGASPLIRLWNTDGAYGPPTAENPYANRTARHPFNVFNDLDHESAATRYWLDRANRYWLEEFHVDGFRFDLSKGFTQTDTGNHIENWGRYDASRVALLTRMADEIWSVDEDAIVILEHFAELSEEQALTNYRRGEGVRPMLVWSNLNRPYNQLTMGYPTSDDFGNSITCTYGPACGYALDARVSYMESHDEQWLMYRNRSYGATADGHDVRTLETALDRQKLAGAFFLLVPGPRMIWQFGELGYGYGDAGEECLRNGGEDECPAIAPGRVSEKPIRWDYYDVEARRALYDVWSALLALRHAHPVFTSPETQVTLNLGEDRRLRTIQLAHPDLDVTVIGNFDVVPHEAAVPFVAAGTYYDVFSDRTATVAEGETAAETLAPGAFRVYTSEPLARPLITDREPADVPAALTLGRAYPNPFNPQTTIPYAVDAASDVRLAVYDVLGRRVAVLADGLHAPGTYEATFDAQGLPSGTYLYRLEAAGRVRTGTLVLVK